jgi:4-diphosphocytidyl-2-C-methyl-D-erythritol kinase
MAPIAIYDYVRVERQNTGISVHCTNSSENIDGAGNLGFRAAQLWLKKNQEKFGVDILIKKKIPLKAGLGGGSSDAARVLQAMQMLGKYPFCLSELQKFARQLGADVPFFLQHSPCRACGIGEQLSAVTLPQFWVIVAQAPFGLSTRKVFENFKNPLTASYPSDKYTSFVGGFTELTECMLNDLQTSCEAIYPVIRRIKDELLASGAANASMSGSGPTVFGLFPCWCAAYAAYGHLKKEPNWKYFVVKGLT